MLIPDIVENFDSIGERIVFFKLKNDPGIAQYYILHSLFISHHLKSVSGEIDFLIIAPGKGIFALEIKHGKVSRERGIWRYENKKGEITETTKGPFRQVSDSMHSLRDYLLRRVSSQPQIKEKISKLLFGTGVIFTGIETFTEFEQEGHLWQVFTRENLPFPISYYLENLSKGWHDVHKEKYWYDKLKSKPTKEDCELILKILRNDFTKDYSDLNKIQDCEDSIEEFTKEQFYLIDFINYNKRCLIQGAAGTGKTVMAFEIVKQKVKGKDKVGFFCFNSLLGKKLTKYFSGLSNSGDQQGYAGTLHKFLTDKNSNISENQPDHLYFSEVLPLNFLIENEWISEEEKFDILIIDEAQDLLTFNYLEVFDLILKNGLKNGNWIMFGDFANQSIFNDNLTPCLRYLEETTGFTKLPPLKINCRNTRKISQQNTLLTGIDFPILKSNSIDGERINDQFLNQNQIVPYIEGLLKSFFERKIPLSKVSILSPQIMQNLEIRNSEYINYLIENHNLTFYTIQSFKGLENSIILLVGFEELITEATKKLLYVGISRARVELHLILEDRLKAQYQELLKTNMNKIHVFKK
jgi:hypothetical protein